MGLIRGGGLLKTVGDVIAALGGNDALYRRFGFSPSYVSNCRTANRFPSNVHAAMTAALAAAGRRADPALWGQKSAAPAPKRKVRS